MSEGKTGTFAERHPKWNMLLAVTVLIIAILAFYSFLGWIFSVVSSIDKVILVTLIGGVLALANLAWGKWLENEKYFFQQREKPYSEFIDLIYKLFENTKKTDEAEAEQNIEEIVQDIVKFSKKLTLWASNNVIKKWSDYRKELNNLLIVDDTHKSVAQIKCLFMLEEVIIAMREDMGNKHFLFWKKKLPKGILLSIFINDIHEFADKLK